MKLILFTLASFAALYLLNRWRRSVMHAQNEFSRGQRRQKADGPGRAQMDQNEALQILGLQGGATEQEIVQAHKRLMQRLHPDKGGSAHLAKQLNNAKHTLLSKK